MRAEHGRDAEFEATSSVVAGTTPTVEAEATSAVAAEPTPAVATEPTYTSVLLVLSGSDDTLILVSSSLPLCLSCLLATLVALASRRIFSKGFLVYLIDLVLVY